MPELYCFDSNDEPLVTAAAILLKKVAEAKLPPAKLVSVAKLQHVFSYFPRSTSDLNVTISVIGPRRKFEEIETWHYWEVAIEGEQLSISSGGHYYDPSTGGDSFTTMNWSVVPAQPSAFDDNRESLWMVPDVQSFPEGVSGIELGSGAYRIEIVDPDNSLLLDVDDNDQYTVKDSNDKFLESPPHPNLISAAMSAQGGQIPVEGDSTFRLTPNVGDYLLWIKCRNPWCNPPDFAIADFWEFREGDQFLITNCERDYPATVEQMEEGRSNLWKVLPGDRLAWVGWRAAGPTLLALFNCLCEGYVYGESTSATVDSFIAFGAPRGEATPEVRRLWMVGYDAAVALGIPRTWKPPEPV